jgi:hypothetical protein
LHRVLRPPLHDAAAEQLNSTVVSGDQTTAVLPPTILANDQASVTAIHITDA